MFSTQAKVGIVTLIAIIALGMVITWKSDIFLQRTGYELLGSFENIEGLTLGSEVRFRGLRVGKVMKIDPGPDEIQVYSIISNDIKIPADSSLRVAFDGLVGLKFLEIKPGTSEALYQTGQILYGARTSGIVDFVDIGAKNLIETKRILEVIRKIVENPRIQNAFVDAVLTSERIAQKIELLTDELRTVAKGVMAIVGSSEFQSDVKGTIAETHKTLSSANEFFSSTGQTLSELAVKPSADIYFGNRANTIKANLDIIQSPGNYLGFGIGEGVANVLSLLDIQLGRKINERWGMRIGVINQKLGGGLDYTATPTWLLSGDIYNISNKPNAPNLRLTSVLEVSNYLDWVLQADDILNPTSNYSMGVKIRASSRK